MERGRPKTRFVNAAHRTAGREGKRAGRYSARRACGSLPNRLGMAHSAAIPTTVYTARESKLALPPSSQATASKLNRPMRLIDAADDDENNADFIEDIHGNTSFLRLV